MPKAKSKSARNSPDSEDEEPLQSQIVLTQTPSMTQAAKSLNAMSSQDIERKVNDLVHFLIGMDTRKLPIKRQDINKHVLKEHSKAFPIFIEKAKEKLHQVFGIQVKELDLKQKSYILVNELDNDADDAHQEWPPEDNSKMGLVMIILSNIFMNGNVMSEAQLEHLLKKLSLDLEKNHEVFGDLKKLITHDFVRQGYIEYIRQPASDPPTYELKWGFRAKAELTKRNVLDFVCQIYGDLEPHQWTSQWQDVLRTEGVEEGNGDMTVEQTNTEEDQG